MYVCRAVTNSTHNMRLIVLLEYALALIVAVLVLRYAYISIFKPKKKAPKPERPAANDEQPSSNTTQP